MPRHADRPLQWRLVMLVAGLLALVVALGVGLFALIEPTRTVRDTGPTAEQITVSRAPTHGPSAPGNHEREQRGLP